jgi:gliding motility-associated-like protein
MRKFISTVIFFKLGLYAFCSHIVGGDMYYDYLGGNNYRITIILFRDCVSTGAAYDDPMSVGIFDMSNNLVEEVQIPFPGSVTLPVVLNNPCVTPPTGICTERAIYEYVINLPPSAGGYNVAYQRCCRGPNVSNLLIPEDTGLTLTTHITGTNFNALTNSSPRFDNYPPLVICNNDLLNFDHSATDPDGDQLVYELITPYAGASDVDPQPQPPPSPPYFPVNFSGGFGALNPLGPGATISINPTTGQLLADPELLGLFVVGIRVKEYRNGQLIGQSDRDFLFKVVNCSIQLAAEAVPQTEASSFVSYCQGFFNQFENNSFGGTNYLWDFGVDTLDTDISTDFAPAYTYPGPGEYIVTLVVNPGWPCTDTSVQTFLILEKLDISFTVEDSMCVLGNSHDFDGFYDGPPNPQISWNFGPGASPSMANTLDVNGVSYSEAGYIPVTISAETGQCTGSYTDLIFLYDVPVINFGIDPELKCAPYTVAFVDSSSSYASLSYLWDFGDGTSSDEVNPEHTYEDPGFYDVTLSIQSSEGCVSAFTLTKNNLVKVFSSPVAGFYVDPLEQEVYHPIFHVTDQSQDGDIAFYIYSDSLYSYERNPVFTFVESGSHLIQQVVENEFGCRDTISRTVSVVPETTVYIPNTFTPDDNDFNNVFYPVVYDAPNYEFSVYNRWGELIFYSTTIREGWNGTYKNEICENDAYPYKLIYIDITTNQRVIVTGFVNLLR